MSQRRLLTAGFWDPDRLVLLGDSSCFKLGTTLNREWTNKVFCLERDQETRATAFRLLWVKPSTQEVKKEKARNSEQQIPGPGRHPSAAGEVADPNRKGSPLRGSCPHPPLSPVPATP